MKNNDRLCRTINTVLYKTVKLSLAGYLILLIYLYLLNIHKHVSNLWMK